MKLILFFVSSIASSAILNNNNQRLNRRLQFTDDEIILPSETFGDAADSIPNPESKNELITLEAPLTHPLPLDVTVPIAEISDEEINS